MSERQFKNPPEVFTTTCVVRFRHCDPAGIVFYPRYFEMINDFVEIWFEQGLGLSFHTLHVLRNVGTPTASVQCDFVAPSRWNDTLHQSLAIERLGGASASVSIEFRDDAGALRLNATMTLVTVDLQTLKARQIPDDLRLQMQRFVK